MNAVPCESCGLPTTYTGTKRCNGCWEVESRLAEYLRSERGRAFVRGLLGDKSTHEPSDWRARAERLDEAFGRVAYALGAERNPGPEIVLAALTARLNEARLYRELVARGCPHGCQAPCPWHRRLGEVEHG